MRRNFLIAAILVSGIGYLVAMGLDHQLFRWILKPGTMLLIIWFAATLTGKFGKYKVLVVIGLIFSVMGDTLLLRSDNQSFVLGLFSFLIAHLVYITAFLFRRKFSGFQLFAVFPVALWAVFLLNELHSGMAAQVDKGYDKLWIPVVLYVVVISCMIVSAVITRNKFAIVGAIFFFLSDSFLAWNMFVSPLPWLGSYGVMVTYYTAQFLIARSILEEERVTVAG